MATKIDSEIRARLDSFTNELTDLIRKAALEAVHEALNGGAVPARPTATRKAPKKAGRKPVSVRRGGRRSTADLEATADAILAHVEANAGARMEEIASAVGSVTKDLRRPVQMLLEAGKLRTEGQKRGTQYFAGRKTAAKKRSARRAR